MSDGWTNIPPIAARYEFDGYGWQYVDAGHGSDWLERHPKAERLYGEELAIAATAAAAEITRLRARVAELEEGLREMMTANKPFTNRPIGAPGSAARNEQDAQIAAYTRARALTKGGE